MNNCKHCNDGQVQPIDLDGNDLHHFTPPEDCIFCGGSGKEIPQKPIEEPQEKDQDYGNPLLDFTINVWKNQNPFEL